MRFPLHITTDMIAHQVKQSVRGNSRYPFVLMLEPLYTCNLACIGCSTERHTGKLADRLPVETCLRAVDDCGAPSVSICGGEPTLYPELKELVDGIIARKRHIYLCTNALVLDAKVFGKIAPQKRLTINVHLDGMRKTHDEVCARDGVFDTAVEMIREAKRLGYHVMTNTTIFKNTEIAEIEELCAFVTQLGVDGLLLSPGLSLRVGHRGHLSHPPGDSEKVPARAGAVEAISDLLDADVPGVRRRPARVRLFALEHGHLHAARLERALLPDRRDVHRRLERILGKDELGLLGVSQGRALPELRHALGLRGVGGAPAVEEPARHDAHGRLEFPGMIPRGVESAMALHAASTASPDEPLTAIVAAMEEEVVGVRARLVGARSATVVGARVTLGRLGAARVALAVTGDGARHARVGLSGLLAALPVSRIVVVGVAGGLSATLEVGALVIADRILDEADGSVYPRRRRPWSIGRSGVRRPARGRGDGDADRRQRRREAAFAGAGNGGR